MKTAKKDQNRRRSKTRFAVVLTCAVLVTMLALTIGAPVADAAEGMTLDINPTMIYFPDYSSGQGLNPYDLPYQTVNEAITATVTSSTKYDFQVVAESDLEAADPGTGEIFSVIPIVNLAWQWTSQPGWHPFSLSSQTIEAGVDAQPLGKEYLFDYRIFSERSGLGWDVKPGDYKTTIKYSLFPSQ